MNNNEDSNENLLLEFVDIFEQIETSCSGIVNSTIINPTSLLISDDDNNENINNNMSLNYLRDIFF